MIAAGENPKTIQTFLGHATITMTFDRYCHLMPGSRDQARARMDRYLAGSAAHLPEDLPMGFPREPETA
jgi:hypothetical protein